MSDIWKGTGVWEGWKLTTDHPMSSYGQPVLVDPAGLAMGPGDILTFHEVLTSAEAAEMWGVGESTVRNCAAAGKFGPNARRTAKNWMVTTKGMYLVFGKPKINK